MIVPPTDEEEFYFYLKLTKPLVLNLSHTNDRIKAAAWVRKLRDDQSSPALRTSYVKLLLFMLQRRRLMGPFAAAPDASPLENFPAGANFQDIAKEYVATDEQLIREVLMEGGYGDWPPYTTACSSDLTEYAATQEIPSFGTHIYFAISREPLITWDKFDEDFVPKAEKVSSGEPDLSIPPDTSPDISSFVQKGEVPSKTPLTPGKAEHKASTKEKSESEKPEKIVRFDDKDKDFAWLDKLGRKDIDFDKLKEQQDKDEFTKEARIPPTWGSNLINVTESPVERRLSRAPSLPYLTPPVKDYKDYMKSVGLHELPFQPKLPRDSLERQRPGFPERPLTPIREHDIFDSYPDFKSGIDSVGDISGASLVDEEVDVTQMSSHDVDPSAYLQGSLSPEQFSPHMDLTSTPKVPFKSKRILHSSLELMKRKRPKMPVPKTKLHGIYELERFIETPEKPAARPQIANIQLNLSDQKLFTHIEPGTIIAEFEQPSLLEEYVDDLEDPAAFLQGDQLIDQSKDEEQQLKELEMEIFGDYQSPDTSITVGPQGVEITQTSPPTRSSPTGPLLPEEEEELRRLEEEIFMERPGTLPKAALDVLNAAHKPTEEEMAQWLEDARRGTSPEQNVYEQQQLSRALNQVLEGAHVPTKHEMAGWLEDARRGGPPSPVQNVMDTVDDVLESQPGITGQELANVLDQAITAEEKNDSYSGWLSGLSEGIGFPTDEQQDPNLWESFGWWTEDPEVIFGYESPTPSERYSEEYVHPWPDAPPTPPIFSKDPRIRASRAAKRIYAVEEFGMEDFEEPVWVPAEKYFRKRQVFSPFRDPREENRQTLHISPLKSPVMKTRFADIATRPQDIIANMEQPELHTVSFEEKDFVKKTKVEAGVEAFFHGLPRPLTEKEKADLADPEELDWSKFDFLKDRPPRFILGPPCLVTPPKYDPNPDIKEEDLDESITIMLAEDLDIINAKLPVTTPKRSPIPHRPLFPDALPPVDVDFDVVDDVELAPSPELVTPPRYTLPLRKEVTMHERLPMWEDYKVKSPTPKKQKVKEAIDLATWSYERRIQLLQELGQKFASPPRKPSPVPRTPSPPPKIQPTEGDVTRPVVPPSNWVYKTPPNLNERRKLHVVKTPRMATPPPERTVFSEDVTLAFESPPEFAYAPDMAVEDLMWSPVTSPGGEFFPDIKPVQDDIELAAQYPDLYAGNMLDDEENLLYTSPEHEVTPERARQIRQEIAQGVRPRSPTIQEYEQELLAELEAEVFTEKPQTSGRPRSPPRSPGSPELPMLDSKVWRQELELMDVQPIRRKDMWVRPKPGKAYKVRKSMKPSLASIEEEEQIRSPVRPPSPARALSRRVPSPGRAPSPRRVSSPRRIPSPARSPSASAEQAGESPKTPPKPTYNVRIENGRVVVSPPIVPPYNWDWVSPPLRERRNLEYYSNVPTSPLSSEAPPRLVTSPEMEGTAAAWEDSVEPTDMFDHYASLPSQSLDTEVLPDLDLTFELPKRERHKPLTKVQVVRTPLPGLSQPAEETLQQAESVVEISAEPQPVVTVKMPPPQTQAVPSTTPVKRKPRRSISFSEFKEVKLISPRKMLGKLGKQKSRKVKIKLPPAPPPRPRTPSPPPPRTPSPPPPGAHLPATPEYIHRVQVETEPTVTSTQDIRHPMFAETAPVRPPFELPPDTGIDIGTPDKAPPPMYKIIYKAPGVTDEYIFGTYADDRLEYFNRIMRKRRSELMPELREQYGPPPTPPREPSPPRSPHILDEAVPQELPRALVPPSGWVYSTPPRLNERRPKHIVTTPRTPLRREPKGFSADVTLAFESPPEAAFAPELVMEDLMDSPDLGIPPRFSPSTTSPIRSPGGRPLYDTRLPDNIVEYMQQHPDAYEEDTLDEEELHYESPKQPAVPEHMRRIREQEEALGLRPRSPKSAQEFEDQMLRELEDEVFGAQPSRRRPSPVRTVEPAESNVDELLQQLEEEVFGTRPPPATSTQVSPARTPPQRTTSPESPGTPELERKLWLQNLALRRMVPVKKKVMRVRPSPGKAYAVCKSRKPSLADIEESKEEIMGSPVQRERMFVPARSRVPVQTPTKLKPTLYSTDIPSPDAPPYVDFGIGSPRRYEPRKPYITETEIRERRAAARIPQADLRKEHGEYYDPAAITHEIPEDYRISEEEQQKMGITPRRKLFAEPDSPPESPLQRPDLSESPKTPEETAHTTRIRFGPDGKIIVSPPVAPPENWTWKSPQQVADFDYYSKLPTSPLKSEVPPMLASPPPLDASSGFGMDIGSPADTTFDYLSASAAGVPSLESEEMPELELVVQSSSKATRSQDGPSASRTVVKVGSGSGAAVTITSGATSTESVTITPKKKPSRRISFAQEKEVKMISPKEMLGKLGKQKSRKVKIHLPSPPTPPPKVATPPPPSPPPPGAFLPETPDYVRRIHTEVTCPTSRVTFSSSHPLFIEAGPVPPPIQAPADTEIDIGSPDKAPLPRPPEEIYAEMQERVLRQKAATEKRRSELMIQLREQYGPPPTPPREPSPPRSPHILDEAVPQELPRALLPPSGWAYSTPPRLNERRPKHIVTTPRTPLRREPKGFSADVTLAFESPPEAAFAPELVMEDLMDSPDLGMYQPLSPIRTPTGRPIYEAPPPSDIIDYALQHPEDYEEDTDDILYSSPEATPEHLRRIRQQEAELGLRPRSPQTAEEYNEQLLEQLEEEVFGTTTAPVSAPLTRSPRRTWTSNVESEFDTRVWRQQVDLHEMVPTKRKVWRVRPKPGKPYVVTKSKRPSLMNVEEAADEPRISPTQRERMFIPGYTRDPIVTPHRLKPTLYASVPPSPNQTISNDLNIGSPIRYERKQIRPLPPEQEPSNVYDYMTPGMFPQERKPVTLTRTRLTFDEDEEEYKIEQFHQMKEKLEEEVGDEIWPEIEPHVFDMSHQEFDMLADIDFEPATFDFFAPDEEEEEEYEGRLPFEGQPDTIFDTSMIDTEIPYHLLNFKWIDMRRRY